MNNTAACVVQRAASPGCRITARERITSARSVTSGIRRRARRCDDASTEIARTQLPPDSVTQRMRRACDKVGRLIPQSFAAPARSAWISLKMRGCETARTSSRHSPRGRSNAAYSPRPSTVACAPPPASVRTAPPSARAATTRTALLSVSAMNSVASAATAIELGAVKRAARGPEE